MNKVVFSRIAAFGIIGALMPLTSAHAVVLEQKWEAGRTLAYKTDINGTMHVQVPANAPIIIAGIPIEVEISGTGTTEMHTLKVDDAGVGTVQVRIPQFNLQGQAMGQKGQFSLLNDTSKVTLNGKAIKLGDGTNPLAKPAVAMRFSPKGKFLGVENLAPAAPKPAQATNKPIPPGQAIDSIPFVVAAITRALPTLWPEKDVQNGDTWQAEINWPIPSPEDPKTLVPTQLGKWDLTLKGEETVEGRVLQRVGLEGTLNIDSAQFEAPGKAAPAMRGKTKQDVKGDVWFDAAAGQIVRTDVILGAHVEGGPKVGTDNQAWADFTGSVQLNLKPAA